MTPINFGVICTLGLYVNKFGGYLDCPSATKVQKTHQLIGWFYPFTKDYNFAMSFQTIVVIYQDFLLINQEILGLLFTAHQQPESK